MSAMEWLKALELADVAEVVGVAAAAVVGYLGGARAMVNRLAALLRKALGPEILKALAAEVAKAVRPAVEKALDKVLDARIAHHLAQARAESDRLMVAAVRTTVADLLDQGRAELREDVRAVLREEGVGREHVARLAERLSHAEGKLELLQGGKRRASGTTT